MADRDIAVKFTGDATDLVQASNKAERSLSDAGKSMGAGLAGLAGPAALAATAVAGVGIAAFNFADAAMEDEAAAAQLAHQLQTAAGASDEAVASAEAYIEVLSKQAALADDELRPALSTLANATGDVGRSQELLALSTDIAAGTGKDLESVVNAVAKGALGNTGALGKLGLATKNAAGETMTLDEVLAGAQEKFKGAGEAAAQTGAGGMKAAGIAFDELKESLGAKLLPVLGGLGDVFTDKVIPAGESLVAWAEDEWPKIMEQIGPSLTELQTLTSEVFTAITDFWAEWGDEVMAVVTKIIEVYIKWLVTELQVFVAVVRWVVDQAKAFWAEWGDTILAVIDFVVAAVQTVATIIGYAFMIIQKVVGAVSAALRGDWGAAWDAIKDAVRLGVDFVLWLVGGIGEHIKGALGKVAEIVTAPFRAAFNAIADLWNRTIGSLEWTVPDWIPGLGGNRVEVPDIPRFSAFGANLTVIMPPGSDGYDVTRQLSTFARTVADPGALTIAVR